MVTFVKSEDKEFEVMPEGNHVAICYRIIDLGTQDVKKYQSEETELIPQIRFAFETPNKKMSDDRPFIIYSAPHKVSTHEKANFRKTLDALSGGMLPDDEAGKIIMQQKPLSDFLGKACQIEVVHKEVNGNTYSNIKATHPLPDGLEVPKLQNESLFFDLGKFNKKVFDKLPQFMQDKIKLSLEYKNMESKKGWDGGNGMPDDAVPF